MEPLSILLLFIMQVHSEEMTDTSASGDGFGSTATVANASLIDDNGDIQNIFTYEIVPSTTQATLENKTVSEDILTHFTETTRSQSALETSLAVTVSDQLSTVDASDTVATVKSKSTTVTDVSTIAESTKEITTDLTTTTESATEISTDLEYTSSITSTSPPLSKAVKTTTEKLLSTILPSVVTEELMKVSEQTTETHLHNRDDTCSFVDTDFKCDEDIVCYGEGEIDCSEQDVEMSPAETQFNRRISISSTLDDFSDYEDTEDGIETFPPYLVGIRSKKKTLPFSLRTGTTVQDTEEYEEYDGSEKSVSSTTVVPTEALFTEDLKTEETDKFDVTVAEAKVDAFRDTTYSGEPSITASSGSIEVNYSTNSFSAAKFAQGLGHNVSTESLLPVTTSIQVSLSTVQKFSSQILTNSTNEEVFTPTDEERSEQLINVRRKRGESGVRGSEAFHVMTLESSKGKKIQACSVTGKVICTPSPTVARCKGKTLCQVVHNTAETTQKAATAKDIKSWAIAVIVICAIAAALTVSLLVYLIFTSWKKLKVQPQSGVTTLTYVNSAVP